MFTNFIFFHFCAIKFSMRGRDPRWTQLVALEKKKWFSINVFLIVFHVFLVYHCSSAKCNGGFNLSLGLLKDILIKWWKKYNCHSKISIDYPEKQPLTVILRFSFPAEIRFSLRTWRLYYRKNIYTLKTIDWGFDEKSWVGMSRQFRTKWMFWHFGPSGIALQTFTTYESSNWLLWCFDSLKNGLWM